MNSVPFIASRAEPLIFEDALNKQAASQGQTINELISQVKVEPPAANQASLIDILKTSDNSYICNFFNHIRNFVKTALEYLFGGNLCKKLETVPNPKIEEHKEILRLGSRGRQVSNIALQKYLQQQVVPSDRGFILNELAGNEIADKDFKKAEGFKTVSIPVLVEGFRNERSHIVNIKIINNGRYNIEFFDSRGYGLTHPKNRRALEVVEQFIKTGKATDSIKSSSERIQTNGHDCGVFVAWHATNDDSKPPKDINEMRMQMVRALANIPAVIKPEIDDSAHDQDSFNFPD